jgi:NAD(P)-dependent dehydrogenase (short-subunit alcohol dehydrogenase family)
MLVLITGASGGIGYELAKKFSAQKGCMVIAVSRNIKSLSALQNEKNGHALLPLKADITKEKDLKKIAATLKRLNMPLDILVNNAGHIVNKAFEKISAAELNDVYATNVLAPFQLIQQALPALKKSNKAHVVNISSMGGFQGSAKFPGLSAYASSKAALAGLTECLAEEFKPFTISVNCLAIGAVQTEMLGKAFPGYKAPLGPKQMAEFMCDFAMHAHQYMNGKIIPVSLSTP